MDRIIRRKYSLNGFKIYVGSTPHPVTVTTRIIAFLIGNPYKPSFVTVTGWGVDRRYMELATSPKGFKTLQELKLGCFFLGVGWGIFNCNPCINKTSVSNPPKSPEFMVISG